MNTDPELLECADCLCLAARRAARSITRAFDRELRPHHIRGTQFSLLVNLELRGPQSIGDLADILGTDRTTLTRNLGPLLKDGLIERAQSGDKRRHELVATPAGRALFKRALPLWAAAEQEVRDAMGAKLTADLHGAIDRSMEKLAAL